VPAAGGLKTGETIALRFRADRLNLFDRETGANLLARA
jgi:hypothetical protein